MLSDEEQFLLKRLAVDEDTGLPLPRLTYEYHYNEGGLAELISALELNMALGCDSYYVDGDCLVVEGDTDLHTIDQLEIYNSLMAKLRESKRRELELEVERLHRELEEFIWN